MPTLAEIMTVADTAKTLGISTTAVHKLIKMGKIEIVPFGKRRFILKESVKAYWERNKGKSKHDPTRT